MRLNKNYKNVFWGVLLVLAAVYVVASKIWILPSVSIFSVCAIVFTIWLFVTGIREKSFGKMLFALACAYMIVDEPLGLPILSFGTLIVATILGSIGLSMIFHPNRKKSIQAKVELDGVSESSEEWQEGVVQVSNGFGETIKYLNSDNFLGGDFDNIFGELTVYFDNVMIQNGTARIYVKNSFGATRLFIPKEWNVVNNLNHSVGEVSERGRYEGGANCTLIIDGTASFGEIEIHYI